MKGRRRRNTHVSGQSGELRRWEEIDPKRWGEIDEER